MQNSLVLILAMTLVSCGASVSPTSPMSDELAQPESLNEPTQEQPSENPELGLESATPKQSTSISGNSSPQAITPENRHLITIVAVASEGFSSHWKVTGECSHDGELIKLDIITLNGDSSSAYVPCIEDFWIYNELYGNGIHRVTVTHGSAQSSLDMNKPISIEESPVDCPSNYTWRHEFTDVFGQSECHAVAYCPSGRPYEYADTVSTLCAY